LFSHVFFPNVLVVSSPGPDLSPLPRLEMTLLRWLVDFTRKTDGAAFCALRCARENDVPKKKKRWELVIYGKSMGKYGKSMGNLWEIIRILNGY
jgi:hypothetical protein